MDFIAYCRGHGILIDSLPPVGVWKRYPTEDHPATRNGAVKWMLTCGFVQNHAIDVAVSVWHPEKKVELTQRQIKEAADKVLEAKRQQILRQQQAAAKAAWILSQCELNTHEYLKAKGFPEAVDHIWEHDGHRTLVVPMRVNGHLVGCQLIQDDGSKKFLAGQRCAVAELVFDNKGIHILCEGYATGLSIQAAMKAIRQRYTIHICFSASNMIKIAATLPVGLIVADFDHSGVGERIAKEIGWPYWLSKTLGNDANDDHQALGLFRFSQSIGKFIAQFRALSSPSALAVSLLNARLRP
jgi:putative DNA primase/helicase